MTRPFLLLAAALSLAVGKTGFDPCGDPAAAAARGYACCKVCRAGKACGDSCISRDKACHKGKGCACDA